MIRIIVDCYGGDHSPQAQVEGAVAALREHDDLCLILTGDEAELHSILDGQGTYNRDRISVVHAPQVIGCDEKPTDAIRLKKDSSMMSAVRLLREDDDIAGMVSCGSTGALVAASMLRIGRVPGVIRPAFCPILPTMAGGIVGICDTGANVDITPDHLVQYAVMGSLYLQKVYGIAEPRVALLNIGVEAEKGDDLRRRAYPLLQQTPGIRFVGNMESRDLLSGNYDLVVTDGFAGNVLVKSAEGTCLEMLKKLKKDICSRTLYKLGALLMSRMFKEEKAFMNYQNYGGSVMLGCAKVVVKGHGSSRASAVARCIDQCYLMKREQLSEGIEQAIAHCPTEQSASQNEAPATVG